MWILSWNSHLSIVIVSLSNEDVIDIGNVIVAQMLIHCIAWLRVLSDKIR